MDDSANARDGHGRFAPGNPGGPGGARRRVCELRKAAQDAVTPDHVSALMRKLLRMGLEGNLTAARIVLEHTCGRAPEAPSEAPSVELKLPRMRTAADCNLAIERIDESVTKGECDLATARVMIDIVQARMKAIELNDHEARIVEIEKAASAVDLPGRNMRRA